MIFFGDDGVCRDGLYFSCRYGGDGPFKMAHGWVDGYQYFFRTCQEIQCLPSGGFK